MTLIEEKPKMKPEVSTTKVADTLSPMDGAMLAEPSAAMPRPENSRPLLEEKPKRRRKPIVLAILGIVAITAAIVATLYFIHASHYESTDDAFIEGHVIPISPQIPARVLAVHVDDNAVVKKGDVLIELDPIDYTVALEQAKGSEAAMLGKVEQAKAQIVSANANVEAAKAEVSVAEANAANSQADYKRYQELSNRTPGAVSKQQFDSAYAAQRGNEASVQQAKAKLSEATSQIVTAEATVKAAQGDVDKAVADRHRAEVNLGYTKIVAPEDGRVTRKNVEPGTNVQTGQSLFALVPNNVWVVANFKETQLDRIHRGQKVEIDVDAYPSLKLTGTIDSIQSGTGSRFSMLPAENATGNFVHVVQRIPVKIILDNNAGNDPDHPLAPGMSVQPEVSIK